MGPHFFVSAYQVTLFKLCLAVLVATFVILLSRPLEEHFIHVQHVHQLFVDNALKETEKIGIFLMINGNVHVVVIVVLVKDVKTKIQNKSHQKEKNVNHTHRYLPKEEDLQIQMKVLNLNLKQEKLLLLH